MGLFQNHAKNCSCIPMFELLFSTKRSPSQGWPSLGNFTGEQSGENRMENRFSMSIPRDWWPSPSKVFLNGFPVVTRAWKMLEFSQKNGWWHPHEFRKPHIPWRIHGAGIYANIYHQYTPNVSIYTSTMDPMAIWKLRQCFYHGNHPSFIPSQPTITHQPQPLRTSNSCAVRASQTKRWPQSEPLGEWKRWQMWKKNVDNWWLNHQNISKLDVSATKILDLTMI